MIGIRTSTTSAPLALPPITRKRIWSLMAGVKPCTINWLLFNHGKLGVLPSLMLTSLQLKKPSLPASSRCQ
ncbi:hypothetical protein BF17_12895 [Yersinia similis]|uniref:Uncharacterized protein n=1 Tax=Yersinia similis TaxID=367190 RepID=A0ABM5PYU4_9GAMM|nr:hypothetical protein BF17_12895 [Yersinia similis]